jgi:hypothetical protein
MGVEETAARGILIRSRTIEYITQAAKPSGKKTPEAFFFSGAVPAFERGKHIEGSKAWGHTGVVGSVPLCSL